METTFLERLLSLKPIIDSDIEKRRVALAPVMKLIQEMTKASMKLLEGTTGSVDFRLRPMTDRPNTYVVTINDSDWLLSFEMTETCIWPIEVVSYEHRGTDPLMAKDEDELTRAIERIFPYKKLMEHLLRIKESHNYQYSDEI